jgi:hypothetical protein
VFKWTTVRTETARGNSATEPRNWPATNITRSGSFEGGEREGPRTERYQVTFRDSEAGKTHDCTFPDAKWQSFVKGRRYPGAIRGLTGGLDCESLQLTSAASSR